MIEIESIRKLDNQLDLSSVIEVFKESYVAIDLEGVIIGFNQSALQLFSQYFKREISIGGNINDTLSKECKEEFNEKLKSLNNEPINDSFKFNVSGSFVFINRNIHKIKNSIGEVYGYVMVFCDVTDQVKYENKLIRVNSELNLLSNVNSIILANSEVETLVDEVCKELVENCSYKLA